MSARTQWQRVSRQRPCPVCGKPDWCLFAGPPDDPAAVICPRVESAKRAGDAGWLHALRRRHDSQWPIRTRSVLLAQPSGSAAAAVDLDRFAQECVAALNREALPHFARLLGVSEDSLRRLSVGWSATHRAWTFPMRGVAGEVRGIRLRSFDGRKWAVRGGREGLFLPTGVAGASLSACDAQAGRLLVCEGPTDTAAALDLGFDAVGRPSCTGGLDLLLRLVRAKRPAEVVVVADHDEPGQRGAERLAAVLTGYAKSVRIITPPAKDLRAWRQRGAAACDLEDLMTAATPLRLAIKVTRR